MNISSIIRYLGGDSPICRYIWKAPHEDNNQMSGLNFPRSIAKWITENRKMSTKIEFPCIYEREPADNYGHLQA